MCECVSELDKLLAPKNARIAMSMQISLNMSTLTPRVIVATEKIDTKQRKPLPIVLASFCPFCGKKTTPSETPAIKGAPEK